MNKQKWSTDKLYLENKDCLTNTECPREVEWLRNQTDIKRILLDCGLFLLLLLAKFFYSSLASFYL